MSAVADTRADGKRWYILKDGERLISASTVTGSIDKYGLVGWAAGLAADEAYAQLDQLLAARDLEPCAKPGHLDEGCRECWPCLRAWAKGASERVRNAAGERGTRLHAATEHHDIWGDDEAEVDDDIADYYAAYKRWKKVYGVKVIANEATVINRSWRYAGQLDRIVKFPPDSPLPKHVAHLAGKTVVVDLKTGKHIGHAEGLQVTGYAHAETLQLPDGSEVDMPVIDGGMILHFQPDKTQMRAVDTGAANWAVFASLLTVAQHLNGSLNAILSRPSTIYRAPKEA